MIVKKNNFIVGWGIKTKKAFTLVEMSVVIVIVTIVLTVIIISRNLITSAKVNNVHQEARDIEILTNVFRNTFDCLAGDCSKNFLPSNITQKVPDDCFDPVFINTGFNTGIIDSNAKRSCMFYEFMALEPQAFSLPKDTVAININSVLGINSANAINRITLKNSIKILNSCQPYLNASSGSPSTTNGQTGLYDAFMLNNYVGAQSLVTTTDYYTFYVASLSSSYTIQTGAEDYGDYTINNQTAQTSSAYYNSSSIRSVTLSLGLNTIRFRTTDNGGGAGYAGVIKDSLGNVVFNARNRIGQTGVGNNIAITGACSGTFCATECYGLLNGSSLQSTINTLPRISQSIAGATQPIIQPFLNTSMWDIRTINATASIYPFESAYLTQTINKLLLIGRNKSTNNINSTNIDNEAIAIANDQMAGFDASFLQQIDNKFDDGMPYTGNIVAGKNKSQITTTTGCTDAALNTTGSDVVSNLGAKYVKNKNIANGCVIGFVIKND